MPFALGKTAGIAAIPTWTWIGASQFMRNGPDDPAISRETLLILLALGVVFALTWVTDMSVRAMRVNEAERQAAYMQGVRDALEGSQIAAPPQAGVIPMSRSSRTH